MIAAVLPGTHDGDLADHDAVRLWLRLLTCATTIEKILRRRLEDEFGTTLPRFDMLAALQRRPDGMTMSELSRALLVSNGNVTGVVRKLAESGHVAVEPLAGDRRVSVVRLTAKGAVHFDRLADAHHRWLEGLMADLSPHTRDDLLAGLGCLKTVLATADPKGRR